MHRFCVSNLSINHRTTEKPTMTCKKYRVLMTVSDPNVSRVPADSKILQNTIISFHKNPPHDAELLELIFSISSKSVGVILEEAGREGRW